MGHRPTINTPPQGRTVAVVGDVYRFLATGQETNGRYTLWEALVPPGGGPPPHVHSREEEGFYVLEGEIAFTVNGERVVATAGTFANMPVRTPHSFKNEGDRPARMLISVAPAGLEQMFFEVGVPLAEGATTAPPPTKDEIERLLAVAPSYGIEILVPGIELAECRPGCRTMKSTVEEIRQRFDADVERFSNLDTGQSATVDAPLAMALVAEAAAATTPHARHVLDVGCGAGNYTLKLLERLPNLDATLIDLSQPMLDRATERIGRATTGSIKAVRGDIREIELPDRGFDIVLAAAVLHHLRTDEEWLGVVTAFYRALRPGGSVWVFDLVESSIPAVGQLMRRRYGEYLTRRKGEAYRDHVFAYVEWEDTPRPLVFQLDLLREVGFAQVDVLHKNVCFAAFGGVKG